MRNVRTESTDTILSDLDPDHLLSPVLQHYVFVLLLFWLYRPCLVYQSCLSGEICFFDC
jgi:hypothetical protein